MPRPVRLQLVWVDELYGEALAAAVAAALEADPGTMAIVNHIESTDGIDRLCRVSGSKRLALLAGRRVIREVRRPGGLLGHVRGHGYLDAAAFPDRGPGFHLYLHRRMVLQIPADPVARRRRRDLECYFSQVFLQRPTSAHGRLALPGRLADMAREARDLLEFIWPHGIALADGEGLVPEGTILAAPQDR